MRRRVDSQRESERGGYILQCSLRLSQPTRHRYFKSKYFIRCIFGCAKKIFRIAIFRTRKKYFLLIGTCKSNLRIREDSQLRVRSDPDPDITALFLWPRKKYCKEGAVANRLFFTLISTLNIFLKFLAIFDKK
jgi:hypothetical protein